MGKNLDAAVTALVWIRDCHFDNHGIIHIWTAHDANEKQSATAPLRRTVIDYAPLAAGVV
jgi:hypothetical protein